jgi:L-iditol 2-dehydrogenase
MKAMMLTGILEMELRDVPDPQINNSNDVLLKVGAVGICGSDIHYYKCGHIGSQIIKYPFTIGHECAGTVENVGKRVKKIKSGDRVFVDPAVPCRRCDQCLANRPNTCRNLRFLGCPGQLEGCLSEYIVMPEECCYNIQEKTQLEEAVLVEPLSIGVYAVKQSMNVKYQSIGILGAGPVGLSVLLSVLSQGVNKIYVTDKLDERVNIAKLVGATWVGNPQKNDIVREIHNIEPLLLDVVFECCGDQTALDQAIDILKPGGKLVIIGIPIMGRVSFNVDLLRRKEISIINVRRQSKCVQSALEMIENEQASINFMITHRFNFESSIKAFEFVRNYEDGVIKAIIIM